jgi:AbrB family looped-hinge helix DNA binding protein
MQATGIVRHLDELGRIVIPKEIRRSLGVGEGDGLEMFISEDGELILRPRIIAPLSYENVRDIYEQMERKDRLALIKSLERHLDD